MLQLVETFSLFQPFSFKLVLVAISLILLLRWCYGSGTPTATTNSSLPSPLKFPILGNLHQLGIYPHRSLQALSRRHGPLMLLHFGSVPVLVVSSAETAREVLKTHDLIFCNRPKSTIFERLLYNYKDISSAPYGEYFRKVKSICVLHLLSSKRVRSFRGVREEETEFMISNIANQSTSSSSSSKELNLSDMFVTLTNDVMSRVALGKKYSDGEDGKKFKELLGEFMGLLGSLNIGDYVPWLAWLSRVNGLNARLDKVARKFDEFLDRVVQDHNMDPSSNPDEHVLVENDKDQKDLVDVLLSIQKENSIGFPIDSVTIKALILDMFAAGTDTYSVLDWAMSELLRHPMVMKKLQSEVRGIVRNKTRLVTEDDLVEMYYLKAVIKETLRLHPTVPLLVPRISTQDMQINGYDVKANTQVLVNVWDIGRDPKSYDKPEEFQPERFLSIHGGEELDYKGNDFKFIPFGAGRRSCPAIGYVLAIIELALANLVQKFDWTLAGDLDMAESNGLTLRRKSPLKAVAIPIPY